MDRIINTKTEQQSIYEIYRACRLCGAGAGYKMPIIQNVVDLDTSGIELTQKIRDCVQIEVHPDDKMPPLICELCVDKVNDFYEFVELCQRTNKRTRMRLGLPPQTSTRVVNSDASSNSGDCILGVTEQVYHNDDSDEPLAPVTRRSKLNEGKLKVVKKENSKQQQKEHPSKQKRPPTPPRSTRLSKSSSEDTVALSRLKQQGKKPSSKTGSPPQPKSILKKDKDTREDSPVPTRPKRPREPPKPEVPLKKVKLAVSSSSTKAVASPRSSKPGPRSRRAPSPPPPPPAPPEHPCRICGKVNSTSQALGNHVRSHTVQYTNAKLACNACEMWFSSPEDAQAHHKWHRGKHKPYHCKRCGVRHHSLAQYTEHIDNKECLPWEEVPDVKCAECWKLFPTETLRSRHQCGGPDARPGGKCSKCRRMYSLLKNLRKHEAACTHKKKGQVIVDPSVQARIRPAQVRVSRCDELLTRGKSGHYDVSRVPQNYGLDRNCVYPYISSSATKTELPRDSMVNIKTELDDYEEQDFVHWDSDTESEEEATKTVDSLSTLTLKKLFSKKCLGKIPRKRRKVKLEKDAFDSILNASEFETTMSRDINNIIDNLGNEDSWENDKNDDNDNGSEEESLLTNYVLFDNAMVANNDNKVNDIENSNDSQSILDSNADSGNNEKVSEENSKISTYDNDKILNKDSAESDKEEKGVVLKFEIENVQEISRVNSIEVNIESGKNYNRNIDSIDISNENDTRSVINNEYDTYEKESSVNLINDVRIESKETLSIEDRAGKDIDNDIKQESTNNDRVNSTDDDTKMDFTEDISGKVSSENTSNDGYNYTDSVNNLRENTVGNKEMVTNNDSENTNNDIEDIKNDTDLTKSCNEKVHDSSLETILNGEVEEKSDKLSFGDMNDISDTEVDDKKLMDALNEHIGENDKITEDINGDIATQNTEDNNHETEVSNEQNGVKNELPNACEYTSEMKHKTNAISDHENAINDLIAENNDIKNIDTLSNDLVSERNDNISESENGDNNCETDKISLEDLLPPKCDTRSMDLDNISDDDFDFDAC